MTTCSLPMNNMVTFDFLQSGKFDRSLFFSQSAAAMLTPEKEAGCSP